MLQYANFVLQEKNAANEATDGCVRTFDARCRVAQSASEQSQLCELSDLPSDSLHENFAWWAVTRRTLKITKLSKLGGGRLHGDGRLLATIR